ncbi:Uncharacterized protein TCM_025196 [Theobroma cacao]|uniref:Uncharacterized protein n=1 Tax=Theobroma cacao TaxID=3641 RepID=A0A061EXL6_THECC|nr:Uncharacterized protein TCM_025196 [Theobroma cacao]
MSSTSFILLWGFPFFPAGCRWLLVAVFLLSSSFDFDLLCCPSSFLPSLSLQQAVFVFCWCLLLPAVEKFFHSLVFSFFFYELFLDLLFLIFFL